MKTYLHFIPVILICFFTTTRVFAQNPVIKYPTPQTVYLGKPITAITVTSTGGAIPQNINPRSVPLASTTGYASDVFVVNNTGDIYGYWNYQIYHIAPSGVMDIFAGNQSGSHDGKGTSAGFDNVEGLTIDASGNIFALEDNFQDVLNCRIRKITPDGTVTTYAEGITSPTAITVSNDGTIYVSQGNGMIMKVSTSGVTSLLAGQQGGGSADGTGSQASFNNAQQMTTDKAGNLYVADFGNSLIRKITPAGVVTTLAGSRQTWGATDGVGNAATFFNPMGIAIDSKGNLLVGDQSNYLIRQVTPNGTVTTVAGPALYNAQNQPTGLTVPSRFFIDKNDNIIYGSGYSGIYYKLLIGGFSISPALPAGLNLNPDGSIGGAPTALSAATNYTVSAVNASGIGKAVINLGVIIPTDPPLITSFTPVSAATGNPIVITGNYFTGATKVTIGGVPAASYYINSPTSIEAVVATGATGNTVTVTNPYGTATANGFKLIPPPVITAITPTFGWKGSTITITGTNLDNASNVQIGGNYAFSYTDVSSTKVVATVGDASSGTVYLYTPAGLATFPGFVFLYPPSVTSISPASAPKGATVTITGTNFSNASAVSFGGTSATSYTVVSPTSITAVVGDGASGQVSVTTPPGTGSGANFTYISAPTIINASPLQAGTGSFITIFGTNLTGAQVTIGNVPATVNYSSPTQIIVIVGAGAVSGNIIVTTPGGSASLGGFVSIPSPSISSFTPASGSQGDKVTISGTNFDGATRVTFGGVDATFTVISSTSINATVGYGASGTVQVITPGGTASLPGFNHLGPAISSFSPTQAGLGQTVTINGSNFTGITEVDFGGVAARSFTIVSSTQIAAVVDNGATGSVTVVTPKGKAIAPGFTHPGPLIYQISPNYAGPLATGPVTITGINFNNATSVTFGGTPSSSFTVQSSGQISAVPPAGVSGDVVVTTALGSGKYTGFTWAQPPTITAISPTAQIRGGTVVITGTNFIGVTSVTLGGVPAFFFNVTPTSLSVTVGYGATGDVIVNTAGGSADFKGFSYNSPVLQSVSPAIAAAGQTVTLTGTNLDGIESVQFGNTNAASFTIISPQQINAVLGTGYSGNVTVNGPKGSAFVAGFTFLPPPVIYSFTPAQGGVNSTISINGQNLLTTSSVTIGGIPAVIVSVTNNTVQATVGTGATGNVVLTTIAGSAQLDGFTWYPVPTITSADPLTANAQTLVSIVGTNFTGVTEVKFGGNVAGFTIVSPTLITATPVYGASGDITVTSPGGTGTLHGFVFLPAPTISSFTKTGDGANASVTISGTNFYQVSDVEFGGVPAKSYTVNSAASITAIPGAGATGVISVTANGGTATIRGYLYQQPPVVNSFSPSSGPVGTTLTITGTNFNINAQRNIVHLGPVSATVVSATATQVVVKVPVSGTGTIVVEDMDTHLLAYANLPFTITNTNHSATFPSKLELSFSSLPTAYAIEDFNGDGKPDLLIAKDDSLYILQNSGDKILTAASFAQKIDLKLGHYVQSMVVGDVDGDGKNDILVSIANSVLFLHNTGSNSTISFDVQSLSYLSNSMDGMSLRDMDMDGRPDLVVGGTDPVYYPNTTKGSQVSFGPRMYLANTSSSSNISFALTDIDGDNKPDAINGSSYSGFSIFHNQSVPGSLVASDFPLVYYWDPTYYEAYSVATADFDGDQKPDIVQNDFSSSNFYVQRNISSPGTISTASFQTAQSFPSGSYIKYGVNPADVDGDGKIDLVTSSDNVVYYFPNQSAPGAIAFGNAVRMIDGGAGNFVTKFQFGDFDGDGRQDIALIDFYNKKLAIYSNSPPAVPVIADFNPKAAAKGQKVTITGKYFDGATIVKFGSKNAGSFTVTSSTTIDAFVGDGESGIVSVGKPLGTDTLSGFRFVGPPVITAVGLPADGSNNITITGSNLTGTTSVVLGGTPALAFTIVSDNSITATLNNVTAGQLTVITPVDSTSYTVVLNAAAIITFGGLPPLTYGDPDFTLVATSTNTGVPVQYSAGNSDVVSITNGTVHILKAGTITITASQPASTYYKAAINVDQVLNIGKKALQVKADSTRRVYGVANPDFSLTYTGFVNGDDVSKLATKPVGTTSAAAASAIGNYDIIPSGGASGNYDFIYTNGVLTITPAIDNFKVAATSVSCRNEQDGSVAITAAQTDNYDATITGNGINKGYPFTSSLNITALAPGSYNVCIIDAKIPGYRQCFDLNITQPQDLSVYSSVDKETDVIRLNLQGGTNYQVHINDHVYSVTGQDVTLPLDRGQNTISVTADKLCQGVFALNVNTGFVPYPNPAQSSVSIDLGGKPLSGTARLFSVGDGHLKAEQVFKEKIGVLNFDMSNLGVGVYSLYLIINNKELVYKIIKQ